MPARTAQRRNAMRDKVIELLLCVALAAGALGCRPAVSTHSLADAIVVSARKNPAHDPQWDVPIHDLAERYVRHHRNSGFDPEMGRLAKQALDAGCRDPFVRYLWAYHQSVLMGLKRELMFPEAKVVAEELYARRYPQHVRGNAVQYALWVSDYLVTPLDPAETKALSDILWKSCFGGINNPEVPEWEARDLADLLSTRWMYAPKDAREEVDAQIDAAFVARFGRSAAFHYLRGARASRIAWRIVDNGHTKSEEWVEYTQNFTLARSELEQAWRADPKDLEAAVAMIGVCQGLTLPRTEMEKWYQRALATGKDSSDAIDAKLDYLWDPSLGSTGERLAFGREVLKRPDSAWTAATTLWGAHWREQTWAMLPPDYFQRPDVWQDIKESLSTYLERYPEAENMRMHYTYHAWLARDWPVFREQFPQLSPERLDPRFIGGEGSFAAMRADFDRKDPLPSAPPRRGDY